MTAIEVQAAEINVLFAEVYDAAPALPRPLKSRHELQFITSQGQLSEAASIAPLDGEGSPPHPDVAVLDGDGSVTRCVKRNVVFLRKAKEFALVHEELAGWYDKFITRLEYTQTACSMFLSVVLSLGRAWKEEIDALEAFELQSFVAVCTLLLTVSKSWLSTAGYETLRSQHTTAASGFRGVVEVCHKYISHNYIGQ